MVLQIKRKLRNFPVFPNKAELIRSVKGVVKRAFSTRRKTIVSGGSILLLLLMLLVLPIPSGREWLTENPKTTALIDIRAQDAQALGKAWNPQYRWVPLSAISVNLRRAVVVAEDGNFYSHEGFDTAEMAKAIEAGYEKGEMPRGASTISQQLAKNLYLSPSRNPIRKLREALITWRLESNLTKNRILELYLNLIEWGEGIFGAEAAARFYFKKPASSLSAYESAYLAAIIPSPRKVFNPRTHPQRVERRAQLILRRMSRVSS